MKKKIMASLLVGSAVVGASLAPLSAQATTTGNTPVSVGVEGGVLPEGNYGGAIDPDPNTFHLLKRLSLMIYLLLSHHLMLIMRLVT